MHTVAVYRATPDGLLRVGTFRSRWTSVRGITADYMRKYPDTDPTMYYVARRIKLFGKWVDGERLPMEVNTEVE